MKHLLSERGAMLPFLSLFSPHPRLVYCNCKLQRRRGGDSMSVSRERRESLGEEECL